jgi:hypothetical protein
MGTLRLGGKGASQETHRHLEGPIGRCISQILYPANFLFDNAEFSLCVSLGTEVQNEDPEKLKKACHSKKTHPGAR